MAATNKETKIEHYRITIVEDQTHKQLWVKRFTRDGLIVAAISTIVVILTCAFLIIAFTPVRTFIPGYPDAHTKRAAINNALKIDSLEHVITRWEFYSENLRRVIDGEDPVKIDSLVRLGPSLDSAASYEDLHSQDAVLRDEVNETEAADASQTAEDQLPIEGKHFFTPLKGVVSQGFEAGVHPYLDITAPAGSVVMAVLDGTVINAGWNDEYEYTMTIQHPGDIITIYKHTQKLMKKTGDKVNAGTPIAICGNAGEDTDGGHIQFELWYKGEETDPSKYMKF